jgi:hypothetical protein
MDLLWTPKQAESILGDEDSFDPTGIVSTDLWQGEDGTTVQFLPDCGMYLVKDKEGNTIKPNN